MHHKYDFILTDAIYNAHIARKFEIVSPLDSIWQLKKEWVNLTSLPPPPMRDRVKYVLPSQFTNTFQDNSQLNGVTHPPTHQPPTHHPLGTSDWL